MTFVVDNSVALAWCFEGEQTEDVMALLARVTQTGAMAPHLWPIEATNGLLMAERRGKRDLCTGPGKLTQALGIELSQDGHNLTRDPLTIRWSEPPEGEIISTTRIGISRGTELPYRYLISKDANVSVPPNTVVEHGLMRAKVYH